MGKGVICGATDPSARPLLGALGGTSRSGGTRLFEARSSLIGAIHRHQRGRAQPPVPGAVSRRGATEKRGLFCRPGPHANARNPWAACLEIARPTEHSRSRGNCRHRPDRASRASIVHRFFATEKPIIFSCARRVHHARMAGRASEHTWLGTKREFSRSRPALLASGVRGSRTGSKPLVK